jgi:glycosyltransferase involved in cell wall biosynthesis
MCVVRAPIQSASGYGEMSRDIVRHLIEYDKFDVKIDAINWGNTPLDQLKKGVPQDEVISSKIITEPLTKQPDVFISISVPTEFSPAGRYNIGITAGIETTQASHQWVEAMNRMDVNFVISDHSKEVFLNSKYGKKNNQTGQNMGVLQCEKPIEVLHNCVDTNVYKQTPVHELEKSVKNILDDIPEDFAYLFVGHWLKGEWGHDRKSVGLMINIFYDIFKKTMFEKKPALVLKTSKGTYSVSDREHILTQLRELTKNIKLEEGETLPNIYLVHGDLTDSEMNSLYNHPKIKANITLTKGEGFGRPLLEASLIGKPIVVPGWSGHLDFLNKDTSILLGGDLTNIHPSCVWEGVIIPEAKWIYVDPNQVAQAMVELYRNYKPWKVLAKKQAKENKSKFNYKAIQKETWAFLDRYIPEEIYTPAPVAPELTLPKLKPLNLPKLKKTESPHPQIKLPKLKKKEASTNE